MKSGVWAEGFCKDLASAHWRWESRPMSRFAERIGFAGVFWLS